MQLVDIDQRLEEINEESKDSVMEVKKGKKD